MGFRRGFSAFVSAEGKKEHPAGALRFGLSPRPDQFSDMWCIETVDLPMPFLEDTERGEYIDYVWNSRLS